MSPGSPLSERQAIAGTVAFVAGVIVAVQGRINGELGSVLGDGIAAAVVNFSVGLVALLILVLFRAESRNALFGLARNVRQGELPWWTLLGGFSGASFVGAQGITVASLGVALFTVATVAGTTGMSLAVDRWGLGPSGSLPVSALRVLAALVATAAVAVASTGRESIGGKGTTALVLLALFAGAAVAFQVAFNGRISMTTGQPTVAALVNFSVGLVVLLVILAIERSVRSNAPGGFPNLLDQPWLYVGGLMGLTFVVSAAWSVRALGVLLFSLIGVAGSLSGAVMVDLVAPTEGAGFTPGLVVGVAMTFAAVALASVRRRSRPAWQDATP